jgi:adenosine deaminase
MNRELLHALPKADLHVHLDGSLRPATMIELAAEYGKPLPATDAETLGDYMYVRDARDLVDYLARFATTLSIMQTADALERIAYELAEDAAAENVRYTEVRFCPALHAQEGLTSRDAVDATLNGLRRAEQAFNIRTGLIICGLRSMSPAVSLEMAEVAIDFRNRGVVAFDLAGAEKDNPPKLHRNAFYAVRKANLAVTCHAGEAYGPASISQAIRYCGANRIGHGTRLFEDPDLMGYVNDFRIPLEICLTSNVQTRVTGSFEEHPARLYFDHGLVVTLNTDNRLMSGTTMTEEFWRAHRHLGFGWDDLCAITMYGFESAFLPHQEKQALLGVIGEELRALAPAADRVSAHD